MPGWAHELVQILSFTIISSISSIIGTNSGNLVLTLLQCSSWLRVWNIPTFPDGSVQNMDQKRRCSFK